MRLDQEIWKERFFQGGHTSLAGIDEAGRGPLAGPVVAAVCLIPKGIVFSGIDDSKKLSSLQRETVFSAITGHREVLYGIAEVEAGVIDQINILQATFLAMRKALETLAVFPSLALIDGPFIPPSFPCPARAIVGGDAKSQLIAAASILAKVTRDKIMREWDQKYPEYGFKTNFGYGTAKHLKALRECGPCEIHRRSFAPLRTMGNV